MCNKIMKFKGTEIKWDGTQFNKTFKLLKRNPAAFATTFEPFKNITFIL